MKHFFRRHNFHLNIMKKADLRLFCMWFSTVACVALLTYADEFLASKLNLTLLLAPFGATAVIIFTIPTSPIAHPKNVILGHTFSALVGVSMMYIFGDVSPLSTGLTVATALIVMLLTNTLHPPGGATALTALVGGEAIHNLGFLFPFFPCAVGAILVVILGKIFNHFSNIIVKENEKD